VELAALGVALEWRRRGIGSALLDALMAHPEVLGRGVTAAIGPAERDVVEPWPFEERLVAARRLLARAGLAERDDGGSAGLPSTIRLVRPPG
jgi:GNAT superfamily N-acetyltransferase